jgi:hypothetical protein
VANIREYTNPIDGLAPSDRGVQSSVELGRHVERVLAIGGNELGQGIATAGQAYDKIKTQQDISVGLPQKAQILDNLTTASDVAMNNADPNDHTAAEKWRTEQMEPLLDGWVSGFSTEESRLWATEQAAQIRQHLTEKTTADQSRNAGVAAVQNYHDTLRGLTNTVLQDPSDSARNIALHTLDAGTEALIASNPFITNEMAAKLREQSQADRKAIGEASFQGRALTNPIQAMQDLQDGKFEGVLDAEQQVRMFGFATQIHHEQLADQRSAEAMSKEQAKVQNDALLSSEYAKMFRPDGSTVIPPGANQRLVQLSQRPFMDPSAIKALGDAYKTAAENKINGTFQTTNNGVWTQLASRIGQPPSSPDALTHAMVDQAYAAHQLSEHDWRFLHQSVETQRSDPQTTAAMTQLNQALERNKALVVKSDIYGGTLDQTGQVRYDELHFDAFQRFQQLQASGMSATEAAKVMSDPRDPRGISSMLPHYMTDNKAGLAALKSKVGVGGAASLPQHTAAPLTTPRQPGESAADYLKRTGG